MTSAITPVSTTTGSTVLTVEDATQGDRRQGDRRRKPASKALVATEEPAKTSAKPASVSPPPPAAFAAQVLGQPGKKRGLRGGPEVLDNARNTYLSREYSGARDRRPSMGLTKKTEI
jgi:hypothetical protein